MIRAQRSSRLLLLPLLLLSILLLPAKSYRRHHGETYSQKEDYITPTSSAITSNYSSGSPYYADSNSSNSSDLRRHLLSLRGLGFSSFSGDERSRQSSPGEQHRVNNLPGLANNLLHHYAGHIIIDAAKESSIFYWLFLAEENPDEKPLLVWLNGGPGCSSMDGLFLELGPLKLEAVKGNQHSLKLNPHSWHKAANLLFIDQPVGTGLSFTKSKNGYAKNDDAVDAHFYAFLQKFFRLHPRFLIKDPATGELAATRPFFLSGESHAGHYIPTIAAHILKRNSNLPVGGVVISLKGIALGNPWMDPYHQYDASEFAYGMGIINQGQRNKLKELEKSCQSQLSSGKLSSSVCFSLLDHVVDGSSVAGNQKLLMYDARKFVLKTTSFPPGHDVVEAYLNRNDVRQALHSSSTPQRFVECANPPFNALSHQDGKGVMSQLSALLQAGLRVLVYAGQFDVICNHIGIERALNHMTHWQGQQHWLRAQPGVWIQNKTPVGYIRNFENLEYLLVLNSGHMLPLDQPQLALTMIDRFLRSLGFRSGTSKIGVSLSQPPPADAKCRPQYGAALSSAAHNSNRSNSSDLWMTPPATGVTLRNGAAANRLRSKMSMKINRAAAFRSAVDYQSSRVLLSATEGDSSPGNALHLVIAHATPLDGAVHLRLKMQHSSLAHHQLHHSKHLTARVVSSLQRSVYAIHVEPGNRQLPIDVRAFESNHWAFADVEIRGLRNGESYTFTAQRITTATETATTTAAAVVGSSLSRRATAHKVKIGCYSPGITQCCGRGECVADTDTSSSAAVVLSSSGAAHCVCDAGHSGQYCDYYEVAFSATLTSNISGAEHLCPVHSFHSHNVSGNLFTIQLDSSPTTTAAAASYCTRPVCHSILELRLLGGADAAWMSSMNIAAYTVHVIGALTNDVRIALDAIIQDAVKISGEVGRRPTAANSERLVIASSSSGSDKEQLQQHQQLIVRLHITGSSGAVSSTVSTIQSQLIDRLSQLRRGLIAALLDEDYYYITEQITADVSWYPMTLRARDPLSTIDSSKFSTSASVLLVGLEADELWAVFINYPLLAASLVLLAVLLVLGALFTRSRCDSSARGKFH